MLYELLWGCIDAHGYLIRRGSRGRIRSNPERGTPRVRRTHRRTRRRNLRNAEGPVLGPLLRPKAFVGRGRQRVRTQPLHSMEFGTNPFCRGAEGDSLAAGMNKTLHKSRRVAFLAAEKAEGCMFVLWPRTRARSKGPSDGRFVTNFTEAGLEPPSMHKSPQQDLRESLAL